MMDKITIKNLHIYAYHGVHDSEKETGQNFYVSAVLYTDLYVPGHSDKLDDTVSYSDAAKLIYRVFSENKYDLIERSAYTVAEAVLNEYPQVEGIELSVSKPEAPIGLEIEDVSVSVELRRHTAYIALGSNIGDRREYLDKAVGMIEESPEISVTGRSSYIETKPYGGVKQDDFLNGVIKVRTYLSPFILLDRLQFIENRLGRERKIHWGPRTIDLDILLYDDMILDSEKLTIPHADMINREFVLKPMCEIAPNLVHPVYKKSMRQLFDAASLAAVNSNAEPPAVGIQ